MLPGNDKRTEMDSMIRSTERITSCLEFFQHVIELYGKKMFEFFCCHQQHYLPSFKGAVPMSD